MGRTLVFLLLFVLLGFGVYYFLFRDRELFSSDEASFKISDTAGVTKVFMADKFGHTVTLSRSGEGWLLNNEYPASQSVINSLLRTLAAQEAAFPVPETKHNTVVKLLSAKSVKVELYNKAGNKFRVFYVGGQADNEAGSYMLMEGATRPYVVQIPGFPGYLTSRYTAIPDDWRSALVCNIPASDLKIAKVFYADEPLNSFEISRDKEGNVKVELDKALNFKESDLNKNRAGAYTEFFANLNCEGYLNGTEDLPRFIAGTKKRCVVDVESWSGKQQHMEVYWMPINKRSKNQLTPDEEMPNDYDADRFYAIINDFKDTVIIQRQIFEKLFRRGYEFYQADSVGQREVTVPLDKKAGSVIFK